MTARPPRRLRPSPERRGEVSVDTHTALSARGEVSSAAPVTQGGRKATVYVPPSEGSVITGTQLDSTGTSITSTVAGSGSSDAAAPSSIAIGDHAKADTTNSVAIGYHAEAGANPGTNAVAIGEFAFANGNSSVAIGDAPAAEEFAVAIGSSALARGDAAVAIGLAAHARLDNAVAIGNGADTGPHTGTVAIGCDSAGNGAAASAQDEFVLGTAQHIVIVNGKLVMADNVGGLHQIVVSTGGALSTVAYP